MLIKYGYKIIFLFLFLTGCASGIELAMNAVAGAVGNILISEHGENPPNNSPDQNKINMENDEGWISSAVFSPTLGQILIALID